MLDVKATDLCGQVVINMTKALLRKENLHLLYAENQAGYSHG